MSTSLSVLRTIENISQFVSDFLLFPQTFTASNAADLVIQLQLLIGAIRELPLSPIPKADVINRINEIIVIVQSGTQNVTEQLLAVLQLLQVVALKINNRSIC